jgi:hypothetical protein
MLKQVSYRQLEMMVVQDVTLSPTSGNVAGRFWIDTGNGHVTLLPTILFAMGMTWDVLPARVLGTLGIVYFWQMFYGEWLSSEHWQGTACTCQCVKRLPSKMKDSASHLACLLSLTSL